MVDSFTDGFLSFSVTADDDTFLTGLSMKETGLKTLVDLGVGTDDTFVRVIAAGRIFVTELDHGNTDLTEMDKMPIDIGFDKTFKLTQDPSGWWDGLDFQDLGALFGNRVTAFDVALDNQLIAVSERGTLAFIDKKRIEFDVITAVPEATSFLLFASAIGMTCIRRKRNA